MFLLSLLQICDGMEHLLDPSESRMVLVQCNFTAQWQNDDRGHHQENHYLHGDRHSGGDRDRYGERDLHSDRDHHSDNRNGEGSHRDREGRSERDGGERSGTHKDSFAVPDPPKRKKSRWDN